MMRNEMITERCKITKAQNDHDIWKKETTKLCKNTYKEVQLYVKATQNNHKTIALICFYSFKGS